MILLVDIGNTRIKWALSLDGILSGQNAVRHAGGLAVVLSQYWVNLPVPEKVVIASGLVSAQTQDMDAWVLQQWQCPVVYLDTPRTECGVINAYVDYQDLGVDRWLGLLACHHFINSAACVIACGTAVTVDAIRADGQHLGGCILPGLELMRSSLNQTGKINIEHHASSDLSPVNASTKAGVYCGTLYAVSKAIDAIIGNMNKELAGNVQYIITGGDAEKIKPLLQVNVVYEKDWLFKGMVISVSK